MGRAWLSGMPSALPSQKPCLWWLGGVVSGDSLRHPFLLQL